VDAAIQLRVIPSITRSSRKRHEQYHLVGRLHCYSSRCIKFRRAALRKNTSVYLCTPRGIPCSRRHGQRTKAEGSRCQQKRTLACQCSRRNRWPARSSCPGSARRLPRARHRAHKTGVRPSLFSFTPHSPIASSRLIPRAIIAPKKRRFNLTCLHNKSNKSNKSKHLHEFPIRWQG
jgi:hypothetical protein